MRKPKDYDAELKALEDKAKQLKARKVQHLGELIIATGADTLTADELAGALVALADTKDAAKREAWARRGAAFFAGRSRRVAAGQGASRGQGDADNGVAARSSSAPMPDASRALPFDGIAQPASGGTREG